MHNVYTRGTNEHKTALCLGLCCKYLQKKQFFAAGIELANAVFHSMRIEDYRTRFLVSEIINALKDMYKFS